MSNPTWQITLLVGLRLTRVIALRDHSANGTLETGAGCRINVANDGRCPAQALFAGRIAIDADALASLARRPRDHITESVVGTV